MLPASSGPQAQQASPLATFISQSGEAPYGGSLADFLSRRPAATCDMCPKKNHVLSNATKGTSVLRKVFETSGGQSSRTFTCYQGR